MARHLTYEARVRLLWWNQPGFRDEIKAIGITATHSDADSMWDIDAQRLTTL